MTWRIPLPGTPLQFVVAFLVGSGTRSPIRWGLPRNGSLPIEEASDWTIKSDPGELKDSVSALCDTLRPSVLVEVGRCESEGMRELVEVLDRLDHVVLVERLDKALPNFRVLDSIVVARRGSPRVIRKSHESSARDRLSPGTGP